jgi:hypothetical protein
MILLLIFLLLPFGLLFHFSGGQQLKCQAGVLSADEKRPPYPGRR